MIVSSWKDTSIATGTCTARRRAVWLGISWRLPVFRQEVTVLFTVVYVSTPNAHDERPTVHDELGLEA